jgi:hypothetical protein
MGTYAGLKAQGKKAKIQEKRKNTGHSNGKAEINRGVILENDNLIKNTVKIKTAGKTAQAKSSFNKTVNHQGTWCPHEPVFCQEGICSGCQIYHNRLG